MNETSGIRRYIDDRPEDGVFRVHQDVFSDPELFELEQRYVFECTWVFLAHDSLLPKPHDFYATHIGRVPVFATAHIREALFPDVA
jgi:hypothetical protein